MDDEYIFINVVAISKKDEKQTGYGWVKFVPTEEKAFWAEKVPGAKFRLDKLGTMIDTNGIYRVKVKTSNPFGMPSFEIYDSEYIGTVSDLLPKENPF